ncbi:AsnC family transcriptional regulator [Thalassorhabdomicrobium marinisediminis]|uniref:AsnC family transcriptional regulator n=2 Tax=Thalassorhabdomicrobium marinisediminis TaxID=2170577 RepID=A0A2T7FZ95_9RHOB|nr:Lrp/AsnC family transcriptional regulator [Thalassorhabdomicrobium marinisediminis]PVA07494.1 AsnC family transcriptional regulator [Thalassorhabdomicrobium marinisediminis]
MHRLDKIDIALLAELARDGRLSKSALARRVGLGPTSCWERMKRLEEAGVITGYRAEFSLRAIGPSVTVFVMVELDAHKAQNFDRFEREIARHDEITGCWAIGGGYDYLMQVVTRDIDSYQALIDTVLEQRAGVSRYFSYIVTKPVKDAPPPFDSLSQS